MNSPDQQPLGKEPQKVPINVDAIKLLWSQTYNREGKPDWSHIFPYYHKDIVFQLMAIINFEIITPKFQKIAASGPSPELEKKQTEL